MKVLILAEHDGKQLRANTFNVITAGLALSTTVAVALLGEHDDAIAEQVAGVSGVTDVFRLNDAACNYGIAEPCAAALQALMTAESFDAFLAPASTYGKNIMPYLAALLDVSPLSDVLEIIDPKTFKRPIYAGNAIATVENTQAQIVMTVRSTAFPAATSDNAPATQHSDWPSYTAPRCAQYVGQSLSESARPDLTEARIVVSGGRALQSAENFALLEALADRLGAAIGASRAAVDAGYVPNDYQVGQTGKVVAPELYIAVGISGAIQHLAGMKDSKVIVAINTDEEAPIFQIADYGLVGDLFDVVPKLTELLS